MATRRSELRGARLAATTTMAQGLAHELNNLLTVVLTSLELLEDPLGGAEEPTTVLHEAEAAARRGAEVARKLLLFAGGTLGVARRLPVAPVVEEALRRAGEAAPAGVALRRQVPVGLWEVEAEGAQLAEALGCLLHNAVEAILAERPMGAVLVRARNAVVATDAASEGASRPHVVLSVEDDGEGMSESVLSHAFEPFFTTRFLGRGLGLSVVYGILRRLGGEVRVRSAPHRGTSVELWLPAAARG